MNTPEERCKANQGAAGVDGIRFEAIEAYGKERWLGELAERLRKKDYRPEAVKRKERKQTSRTYDYRATSRLYRLLQGHLRTARVGVLGLPP